jgi:hypothetical protein
MITLKNSSEIKDNLWWREYNLQLTKYLLERYQETKDEFYYQQAKIFGEWAKLIKEKYL